RRRPHAPPLDLPADRERPSRGPGDPEPGPRHPAGAAFHAPPDRHRLPAGGGPVGPPGRPAARTPAPHGRLHRRPRRRRGRGRPRHRPDHGQRHRPCPADGRPPRHPPLPAPPRPRHDNRAPPPDLAVLNPWPRPPPPAKMNPCHRGREHPRRAPRPREGPPRNAHPHPTHPAGPPLIGRTPTGDRRPSTTGPRARAPISPPQPARKPAVG